MIQTGDTSMKIEPKDKIEIASRLLCAMVANPEITRTGNSRDLAEHAWSWAEDFFAVAEERTEPPKGTFEIHGVG
jgi:hypothetical protein